MAVLALPRGRVVEGTVLDEEALLLGFLDPEEALAAMLARGVIEPVEAVPTELEKDEVEPVEEGAPPEEARQEPAPEEAQAKGEAPKGGKRKSR
ncbi:hypothetical protein MN1_820 [Thermus phage MN1]|nr:hypothetical protein MN1_820 [Thermus phage MN1]